jgi:hypothetical protein
MRRGVLAVGLLVLVAGCGQTDFATQVTAGGAHLNATITSVGDQDTGWFEWWPASNPSDTQDTTHRSVTRTGWFEQAISGLSDQTEYRYRFCGSKDGSGPVCAQTRHFTTGRDSVQAYGETILSDANEPSRHYWSNIDFDLVGGAGTTGLVAHFYGGFGHVYFQVGGSDATVTCFRVDASTAIIGLRRTQGDATLQSFVQLVDGGALGSGQDTAALTWSADTENPPRAPSDCSTPVPGGLPLVSGEIVVTDAP